jgi:hypothetical protein
MESALLEQSRNDLGFTATSVHTRAHVINGYSFSFKAQQSKTQNPHRAAVRTWVPLPVLAPSTEEQKPFASYRLMSDSDWGLLRLGSRQLREKPPSLDGCGNEGSRRRIQGAHGFYESAAPVGSNPRILIASSLSRVKGKLITSPLSYAAKRSCNCSCVTPASRLSRTATSRKSPK